MIDEETTACIGEEEAVIDDYPFLDKGESFLNVVVGGASGVLFSALTPLTINTTGIKKKKKTVSFAPDVLVLTYPGKPTPSKAEMKLRCQANLDV